MADNDAVSDLVRRLFAAFLAQDREALEDILSDDFTFNSPRDDHISKAEYFERCFPYASQLRRHQIEQLFTEGNEALVRYVAESRDGGIFRNTEYFRTDGNKVKEVDVYFGGPVTKQQ
jgi:ketosteroid isomerase-like protein